MNKKTIKLGDLTISRLLGGCNPVSGFSHQDKERDNEMLNYFTLENIKGYFRECEKNGIDTICARTDAFILRVFREYWNEGGTVKWVAQATSETNDITRGIDMAYHNGASAVYINGNETIRLFEAGEEKELFKSVEYGKKLGLPTGAAAHNPEHHLWMQNEGLDVDFHLLCLYNAKYSSAVRAEIDKAFIEAHRGIALSAASELKKPCIFFKILGAGRKTLEDGLADIKQVVQPKDGFLIGMYLKDDPNMVRKNAEAIYSI